MTIAPDAMRELADLAQRLKQATARVEETENDLKDAKVDVLRLATEDIPNLMSELELTKIVLQTGETIEIKNDVYASIAARNREAAFAWLEANGFGGLIKTCVSVEFGKDGLPNAIKLYADLEAAGIEPEMERDIHTQTLRAFLREQLEKGANVPLELFGAMPVKVAAIKEGKNLKK